MKKRNVCRGLPGSGKSTLAAKIADVVCSADDFFMQNGQYNFDSKLLAAAHDDCFRRMTSYVNKDVTVAVANTFSMYWEMKKYVDWAARNAVPVQIVDLFDAGMSDVELAHRNVHGVPEVTIAKMRARWEV